MARRAVDPETLKIEIARLRDFDITELRNRWLKLYDRPAPKTFRRNLLVRGVAYQMQVEVYGGLSTATKRRLREIAEADRAGNEEAVILGPRIKPGTRLYRVWNDKTHSVTVLADGFEWRGSRYGVPVRGRQGDHRDQLERVRVLRPQAPAIQEQERPETSRGRRCLIGQDQRPSGARSTPGNPPRRGSSRISTRSTPSEKPARPAV